MRTSWYKFESSLSLPLFRPGTRTKSETRSSEMAAVENVPPEVGTPEKQQKKMPKETFEPPPLFRAVMTYISYLILYAVSLFGDTLRKVGLVTTGHVEVTKKEVSVSCTVRLGLPTGVGNNFRTGSR